MGTRKKGSELVFNLQWRNKADNGGDKSNVIGMYDTPTTTSNFEMFKSYLLKNSGVAGNDVKVTYLTDNGQEWVIDSQESFDFALSAFRLKARLGEVIFLKLDKITNGKHKMLRKHSNDVETQSEVDSMGNNVVVPPEWFITYMKQFKRDIVDEVTYAVSSNLAASAKEKEKESVPIVSTTSKKSKPEASKRSRKHIALGETPIDKEFLKTLKFDRKLENKLDKLDAKTKKIKEKKQALMNKIENDEHRHFSIKPLSIQVGDKDKSAPVAQKKETLQSEITMTVDGIPLLNGCAVNSRTYQHMMGGEVYLHKWYITNTGRQKWSSKTELRLTWGSAELVPFSKSIRCPSLKPGEQGNISVKFEIPKKPGTYESYWNFYHEDIRFGNSLSCHIIVEEPLTATVSPTSTYPQPTFCPNSAKPINECLKPIIQKDVQEFFKKNNVHENKIPLEMMTRLGIEEGILDFLDEVDENGMIQITQTKGDLKGLENSAPSRSEDSQVEEEEKPPKILIYPEGLEDTSKAFSITVPIDTEKVIWYPPGFNRESLKKPIEIPVGQCFGGETKSSSQSNEPVLKNTVQLWPGFTTQLKQTSPDRNCENYETKCSPQSNESVSKNTVQLWPGFTTQLKQTSPDRNCENCETNCSPQSMEPILKDTVQLWPGYTTQLKQTPSDSNCFTIIPSLIKVNEKPNDLNSGTSSAVLTNHDQPKEFVGERDPSILQNGVVFTENGVPTHTVVDLSKRIKEMKLSEQDSDSDWGSVCSFDKEIQMEANLTTDFADNASNKYGIHEKDLIVDLSTNGKDGTGSEKEDKEEKLHLITNEDNNNNNGTMENNNCSRESLSEAESEASSVSSGYDVLQVPVCEEKEDSSGYVYITIDGNKLPVPKHILRPDFLANAEEAPGPISTDDERPVEKPVDSKENTSEQANATKKTESPIFDAKQDIRDQTVQDNKPSVTFASETSISVPSDSTTGRLFIFPQNQPGYEVFRNTSNSTHSSLDRNDSFEPYTWSKSPTQYNLNDPANMEGINPMHLKNDPYGPLDNSSFAEYQPTVAPEQPTQQPTCPFAAYGGNHYYQHCCMSPQYPQVPNYQQCGTRYKEQQHQTPSAPPQPQQQPEPPKTGEQSQAATTAAPVHHILPENLVSGAVNVASSAINTARSVINMLASPKPEAGRWMNGHWVTENPESLRAKNLVILAEMGFWDTDLNATLLARYNDDIARVITELVQ